MKIFILFTLFAIALAEPPVGDGYSSTHSNHGYDYSLEATKSLSQEYGVPATGSRSQKVLDTVHSRSQPSSYFPSSKSSLSKYGPPSLRSSPSETYGPPAVRSRPSEDYGVPNARVSQQYGPPIFNNAPSSEYGVPSLSSDFNIPSSRLSQEYGTPELRSGLEDYKTIGDFPSDSYGAPVQKSPTSQYGPPQFRSNPSKEYGVPSQNTFLSSQRSVSPVSHKFFPALRSSQASQAASSVFRGSSSVQSRLSKPSSSVTRSFKSSFGHRNIGSQNLAAIHSSSTQYDISNTKSSHSYVPNSKSISQSYVPSVRTVSQTYGVPNVRAPSSEYGPPEARANLQSNVLGTSSSVERMSPSPKYGIPDDVGTRISMPSDQYGVPEQYAHSDQGYDYARNSLNSLNELLNQEPANYGFGYKVNDFETGSDFGHTETRQDNKAEGSYFVVLPDGTKQIVEYEADERGFKPRISVEPAETRSGYDDNANNLDRSANGPY